MAVVVKTRGHRLIRNMIRWDPRKNVFHPEVQKTMPQGSVVADAQTPFKYLNGHLKHQGFVVMVNGISVDNYLIVGIDVVGQRPSVLSHTNLEGCAYMHFAIGEHALYNDSSSSANRILTGSPLQSMA